MKLRTDMPVVQQLNSAQEVGAEFVFDVRSEAMGDKVAALNVVELLTTLLSIRIMIIEAEDEIRTTLSLMRYSTSNVVSTLEMDDPLEGLLDLHTLGTGNESLWLLNAYAAVNGFHGSLGLITPKERGEEVVICLLEDTLYNERRDMDPRYISVLVSLLEQQGYVVTVVATSPHPKIPQIRVMSTDEALFQIATAGCVIAGDTGFSHAAAAMGTPLVGIWPDWHQHGRARLGDAIKLSAWWELPLYQLSFGFYPNGDPDKIKIVELGTNHAFSPEHVLQSVQSMYPLGGKL